MTDDGNENSAHRGWVLDCHLDGDEMVVWVKLEGGKAISVRERWRVALHVAADIERLEQLARWLGEPELHTAFGNLRCRFERHSTELGAERATTVLSVSTDRPSRLAQLAAAIDGRGDWHHHHLYSVDQKMAQRHLLDRGVHPFGRVSVEGNVITAIDERLDLSLDLPPLKIIHLHCDCHDQHGQRRPAAELSSITIQERGVVGREEDGPVYTIKREPPSEMLARLHHLIRSLDPDVIVTDAGDSVDLPALRRLAASIDEPLLLGRSEKGLTPRTKGRTTWSYGRLLRRESYHALEGRIHIDMAGSFIVREGGVSGLIELARMAGLSGQDISRLSPGSAISAMQMRLAMEDGVLVPWKKNRPEDVKDGLELLAADRGGLYLDPVSGYHERVVELDFASLFPSIIATRNISPETLNCLCCQPPPMGETIDGKLPLLTDEAAEEVARRLDPSNDVEMVLDVPELNLHTCTRRHGFLGRVVAPIIERRAQLKSRRVEKGDVWDGRQNALKWVLVTCFGYTGYRNARFGRIECHEAICAWAREILLQAIEIATEEGWETLHAIVDSMWLTDTQARSSSDRLRSIESIKEKVLNQIGIPIDLEDEYEWICFIPNRTSGVGALTKYFGHGGEGWKVRGIELRQHSTCPWVERLQREALETLKFDTTHDNQLRVINYLHEQLESLTNGEIPLSDLIVGRRIRKELGDQRVTTITTAALSRAAALGHAAPAGRKIHFAVVAWRANDLSERVRLAAEIRLGADSVSGMKGDVGFYEPLARRAVWAILSPFGWDEEGISRRGERSLVLTLDSFGLKSERSD